MAKTARGASTDDAGVELPSRYSVDAIVNGANVLQSLASEGTLNLGQVSQLVGVSKSSAFRLLATFESLGLVAHENRGSYRLGGRAFRLASQILEQFQIGEIARPYLEELRTTTGETVNLAVVKGRDLIYESVLESAAPLRTAERRGVVAPIYATAIGRSTLSQVNDRRLSELLPQEPYHQFTENTVRTKAELLALLEEVGRRGYAVESEECTYGVLCVAAPLGIDGIEGAISISAPLSRVPEEMVSVLGGLAAATAKQIRIAVSATLGGA